MRFPSRGLSVGHRGIPSLDYHPGTFVEHVSIEKQTRVLDDKAIRRFAILMVI